MDNMGISTEPSFLEVELPQTLLESPSTSTFLPDEEASVCPLLHSNNSALDPVLLSSHPLSPNIVANDITSSNISNTDCKAETSSSGSSDGIAMDAMESTSTNLFNKVNYHHLQNNNITTNQASNNHFLNGNRRQSKETPNFVSWNWPIIRKCTFFLFISGIMAMCSIVIVNIATMPKVCNPKISWYRGSVFYEINPAAFIDSDHDQIGDIGGIINRIEYFANMDISGLRLNSIFPSGPSNDRHINGSSLITIRPELGSFSSVRNLANILHSHNINLLLDLPLQQVIAARSEKEVLDVVSESLEYWIDQGVNGFYLKGLDSLKNNAALSMCLSSWKRILGKNRVLIVEESIFKDKSKSEISLLLDDIDLVDVVLNVENNAIQMKERIQVALNKMPIGEEVTWVQWSLSEVKSDNSLPSSNLERIFPATIMQLTLPGTTNILHTNEVAIAQNNKNRLLTDQVIQHSDDGATDQQTDSEMVHRMISLRERSPAIYKSFICKSDSNKQNTQILAHSSADILIVVRNYPRKNSLVSVTNFGSTKVTVNLSSKFYSGIRMLMTETDEKIYFERLKMFAYDTVVVKLDK
ncbi:4F2 cell-surface antigen heavy chain [Drosophila grimshawi]|uniref:4F2 cell-surface antigen heavy chain n=1 Tax=Drosophila grimshawi TaxID=7222 RepID=UPI000C86E822|nr:4F2 cell-surface antigen heavy chain [Drosophila grimshawi]